ncbi:hypothetical protein N7457_005783 [Penicillium paradoxum]|uniref:uncharacterized protein n=1 Tax=Penicillium paradoxum TaxID=176176 RepID=UPI002546E9B4|nr:uncharacterized protein N7457_005783 [Penicillium paradoxum]KAJ5780623.1 hypothetical protein N7457_005783 [Penicillium paradoxum]
MRRSILYLLCCFLLTASGTRPNVLDHSFVASSHTLLPKDPIVPGHPSAEKHPKACKGNTPSTRHQWCKHNLYTDYTATTPDTGVTQEFWLNIDQATLAPDGRPRWGLTINGSLPGPTLEVNWGDTVVIHLRNNLPNSVRNGTSLHIHGLRQYYTNPMDGVVSVTQCPLAPGHTMTYRWRATQYGTTWYHSHIGLQTWEGVYGGLIVHGPASSNYDEDKGVIQLTDWDINTVDQLWRGAETGASPVLDNALINGVNMFGKDGDPGQTGYRFNTSFTTGKSYLLRVTNVACDTHFKFSIDHHTLTVIAMDLVPIRPYNTTAVNVAIGKFLAFNSSARQTTQALLLYNPQMEYLIIAHVITGQRYDVIVHANQVSKANSFWLRATPQLACSSNSNADNIRGIIYYNRPHSQKSNPPLPLPTTTPYIFPNTCEDEPASSLIPIISKPLALTSKSIFYNSTLPVTIAQDNHSLYHWYLNGTSMQGKWNNPTLLNLPTNRASLQIPTPNIWVLVIIETTMNISHPIHLHGHDFLVVAQGTGSWTGFGSSTSNMHSLDFAAGELPKRDTALLPASGYLVLAFRSDNPGVWLMHCHIGWHLDQGFAVQIVERAGDVERLFGLGVTGMNGWGREWIEENCAEWERYNDRGSPILEDGAGV